MLAERLKFANEPGATQAGLFPVGTLITHHSFADISTAIADMKPGKTIKPVLEMR